MCDEIDGCRTCRGVKLATINEKPDEQPADAFPVFAPCKIRDGREFFIFNGQSELGGDLEYFRITVRKPARDPAAIIVGQLNAAFSGLDRRNAGSYGTKTVLKRCGLGSVGS
jgi:hypothetical protein